MKKQYQRKNKRSWGSFILLLFYVNVGIDVAGEIYWDLFHPEQPAVATTAIQEDSNYGRLITKYAQRYGLDWRFVASIIQAESSFKPDAVSSVGAVGLMQVLPWVAHADGVTNIQDPEENIRFGLKHYTRYFKVLRGQTMEDTLKINLAAYNAGIGHIRDAKRLAKFMGKNPNKWSSIEKVLPLLEDKEFYTSATYGYCQGTSVVAYVHKIFKTYGKYREKHPEYPVLIQEM